MENILKQIKYVAKKLDDSKKTFYFDELHAASVDQAERISTHSTMGKFPMRLFTKRAPNQTQEEFDYIEANYKTITFPIWAKFKGLLNRIWNDANWSISYNGNSDLEEYCNDLYPTFNSLEAYFKDIVTPSKEKDPNAVLSISPYKLPIKKRDDGTIYFDETQLIDPVCKIHNSKNIVEYIDNRMLLVLSTDLKTKVKHYDEEVDGLVFEYFDKDNIYHIYQVGEKKDYNFEAILYYNHNLGYLPCEKLKGEAVYLDDKLFYQSSFLPAVDLLDLALLDNSYLTAQKATHAFQHKWEYVDECDYTDTYGNGCVNGSIYDSERNKTLQCPRCSGSGKSKPSILGVYQIKMPTRTDDTTKGMQLPPFGWEAPDPTILEYLRAEIKDNMTSAMAVLGLVSDSNVQGSDTALGKMIDREESFSMLLSISNQIFTLYQFTLDCINDYRYMNDNYATVTQPKTFAIRTETELSQELTNAKEKGMPEIAIRQLLLEYLERRFATSENNTKIVDLAFYVDRIMNLTNAEIAQKKLNGTIAAWEDILHTSLFQFAQQALKENANFFDLSIEEQSAIVVEKAKQKEASIRPVSNNRAENILNNIGNA
jgi:hypothetical protein